MCEKEDNSVNLWNCLSLSKWEKTVDFWEYECYYKQAVADAVALTEENVRKTARIATVWKTKLLLEKIKKLLTGYDKCANLNKLLKNSKTNNLK